MSLTIHDCDGNEVGSLDVDAADFAPSINRQLLHDVVVMYEANLRQGSHKTKSRGQVKGSSRKMYRQKGTGNARAGSRRSGVRRSGGHIHAIHNRDYSYRLTKKAIRVATRMAMASRLNDDAIVLVDKLELAEPKTSRMAEIVGKLGLSGTRLLLSPAEHDINVFKSARNLPGVKVSPATDLNARDILVARKLLLTTDAFARFRQRFEVAEKVG